MTRFDPPADFLTSKAEDSANVPPFPDRVYRVVAAIPRGRVTTYGLIARALGAPRSARIVGGVLQRVPDRSDLRDLPCHRVVNRIGFLSGGWHFGHPNVMRDRLLAEDVPFRDEYQVDLRCCLWDPADHLDEIGEAFVE